MTLRCDYLSVKYYKQYKAKQQLKQQSCDYLSVKYYKQYSNSFVSLYPVVITFRLSITNNNSIIEIKVVTVVITFRLSITNNTTRILVKRVAVVITFRLSITNNLNALKSQISIRCDYLSVKYYKQ